MAKLHNKPGTATPDAGEVSQDGPGGTAVSYTPGAALETGHRLIDAGLEAERQQDTGGQSPEHTAG